MSQPQKLWVFSSLVQDKEDPQQLIAYAIYKSHKEERAQRNKLNGMTDIQIKADLESWHDDIAQDRRILDTYEDKAFEIISAVIEGANQAADYRQRQLIATMQTDHQTECDFLRSTHQIQCQALQQQIEDAEATVKTNWLKHVAQWTKEQNEPIGWRKNVAAVQGWVGSSISGALGALFVALLIGGIATVLSADTRKAANSALKYVVDIALPDKFFESGVKTDPVSTAESGTQGLTNSFNSSKPQ